jgi:pimeloyl-ACP methyl ester carboxylesterase
MLSIAGIELELFERGQGAPILYLHGGEGIFPDLPFLDLLAKTRRVIAPSHPGFGRSSLPDWVDSVDDIGHLYLELMDHLGLTRTDVVGFSLGGWIAAEIAVFHPRRLESLTLVTPIGLRIPGKPVGDVFAMDPEALFMTMFNDPTNAPQILPDIESLDEIEHQFGEMATLARLAWNPRFDPKLERRLERVSCPTLVVRAEHDRLVPDEMAERYAELIDGARLETVPGTGHALVVEQPEKTADVISSFIQESDS